MIIGLKLRSFTSPLKCRQIRNIISISVIYNDNIFTIIVQKMAKILVLLEAGRSLPYYRKLTRFQKFTFNLGCVNFLKRLFARR